jgi:hypothetical protein
VIIILVSETLRKRGDKMKKPIFLIAGIALFIALGDLPYVYLWGRGLWGVFGLSTKENRLGLDFRDYCFII